MAAGTTAPAQSFTLFDDGNQGLAIAAAEVSTPDVEIVDGCAAGPVIPAGGRIRDDMVAQGWLAESDGSDRVVMCAPG